jgi:hypothetical protein
VVFQSEKQFRWDGQAGSHVRLGYAPLTEAELEVAVKRLGESLPPALAAHHGLAPHGVEAWVPPPAAKIAVAIKGDCKQRPVHRSYGTWPRRP